MSATATWNVSASATVVDLYAFLISSSVPLDQTPPHTVVVENNGAGALRLGVAADVSTSNGHLVGPGQRFMLQLPRGSRLGLVGDGGAAAASITATLLIGG